MRTPTELGIKIKTELINRNMTQDEIIDKLNITKSMMTRVIYGDASEHSKTAIKVKKYLEIE